MEHRNLKLRIFTAICLILATSLSTPGYATEEETFSATLVEFEGEVFIQKPEEDVWLPVEKDIPLEEGDRIKTGNQSCVEILMDDGSLLKLEQNSEITLSELSADHKTKRISSRMSLWFGRLLSNIVKFTHSRSRFDVHTPAMIAGVRGTEFVVETTDSEQTDVGVFEGQVAVGGIDQEGKLIKESEVLIPQGNQTSIRKNKRPLAPFKLKKRMLAYKKGLERLRKKAVDRRRNLPEIIGKRAKAREQILKKWKKIRQERLKKPKSLKQKTRQKRPKKIKRPKQGIRKRLPQRQRKRRGR